MGPLTDATAGIATLATGPFGTDAAERLRGQSAENAAREFEVLFLAQVIGAMRKTVPESGLLSPSPERRILDGAFDEQMARSLAERAHLGLADQIAKRLQADESGRAAGAGAKGQGAAQVYRQAAESPLNERS